MRGKVREFWIYDDLERITPAYAGKSKKKGVFLEKPKDHPRLCGEKQKKTPCGFPRGGITPAYAGKSVFAVPFFGKT